MCIRDRTYIEDNTTNSQNTNHRFNLRFDYAIDSLNQIRFCLLYTSDAADERSSVDLGGRRIIKKKKNNIITGRNNNNKNIQ